MMPEAEEDDMDEYKPVLNRGEFLGHGWDDDGREYEGYMIDGEPRYFHTDDESEIAV